MNVIRTLWRILYFDKLTEKFVPDYELDGFGVEGWRRMIGMEGDNDEIFQGQFPVVPEHLEFLQPYVPEPIDLDTFDCFVEFCAVYDWGEKRGGTDA